MNGSNHEPIDTVALCGALPRHTESEGSEVFEKNYLSNEGEITATVFCFVGERAAELTAMVREHLQKELGMKKTREG